MARQQYRDQLNQVRASLRETYAEIEKNRDLAHLYKTGIVPQAQQSFDAGLSAYQVGRITFLELLDSLRSLYRYQIDYHRVLSNFYRSRAKFSQLAGEEPELYVIESSQSEDGNKP
jgi:outer membrane protein TolC